MRDDLPKGSWLLVDPVELTALRTRIAELEATVRNARDVFRAYGDLHAAKPDIAKAKRNYDLADEMQRALSGEREG